MGSISALFQWIVHLMLKLISFLSCLPLLSKRISLVAPDSSFKCGIRYSTQSTISLLTQTDNKDLRTPYLVLPNLIMVITSGTWPKSSTELASIIWQGSRYRRGPGNLPRPVRGPVWFNQVGQSYKSKELGMRSLPSKRYKLLTSNMAQSMNSYLKAASYSW